MNENKGDQVMNLARQEPKSEIEKKIEGMDGNMVTDEESRTYQVGIVQNDGILNIVLQPRDKD
ncbi:hypothetical protein [Aneurinibacillus uraniidurans]|uniref:hypothetical protein n=1 Tax=Aneurinibacillus uraniidurans TaxID=2966586 RepID=UPI00234B80D2|nr:hypothetical protein [Aneurinibacillus sp. B1]WCN36269.1 hypothetical protein PO771_10230 [Aneurinibacillus sp. B1]